MFEGSNRDALPLFQGEASWGWGLVWGTQHPGIGWQKLSPVGAAGNGGVQVPRQPRFSPTLVKALGETDRRPMAPAENLRSGIRGPQESRRPGRGTSLESGYREHSARAPTGLRVFGGALTGPCWSPGQLRSGYCERCAYFSNCSSVSVPHESQREAKGCSCHS